MKIKKVLIVLSIPFAVNFFIACCDCLEVNLINFTHCSISLENLDNSGATAQVDSSGQILRTAYGLRVSVQRSENICVRSSPTLFVHSAYAYDCHCPPPEKFTSLDSIVSINIKTLNEFDDTHPAGTNINDYFNILWFRDYMPLESFNFGLIYLPVDPINEDWMADIMLLVPPPERGTHQFEVAIELSDGRILNAKAPIVELQ
ncbi:MAG: DUF5034 domain-containing protein [Bacteroidota bacterium]